MAKYCVKCGSPLDEGQVCSCMANQQPVQQPVDNMVQQPVQNTTTSVNMEQTKNFVKNLLDLVVSVFKQPYTAAVNYVRSNDILTSIILFVIQGLLTGIMIVTVMNRAIDEIMNGLGGMVKGAVDLNPVGTVIVALLISVVLSFAYAAVLLLATLIFKVQVNYTQCIRIMGVRSVAMIGGTLVALVITFLSAGVGLVIGMLVVPSIGFLYTVVALKACTQIDENKLVYLLMVYMLTVKALKART